MPWWSRVWINDISVVSWPPCWVAVEQKTPPGLPTSPPRIQIWPVESRNWRIWPHMLPKRVGVPKTMASAASSSSSVQVGTSDRAFWASVAPIFPMISADRVSGTRRRVAVMPGT